MVKIRISEDGSIFPTLSSGKEPVVHDGLNKALKMKLPFTREQFFEVFQRYNISVYPLQVFFLLLAVLSILIIYKGDKKQQKIVPVILATLWFWMGTVYHIRYFSVINKVAYLFGVIFILQSIFFLHYGLVRYPLFWFQRNIQSISSVLMLIYALIIYPLIGDLAGHGYPYAPTFGLPCPTTIFTIAIFLVAEPRIPFYLAIVPLLWSVIGFSAAFSLAIYEDAALIISALAFTVLYFRKRKSHLA
jgi:hypothetical protein